MSECTWIGFIGYILAFLLFLVGSISGIKDMSLHILFAFKKSLFFKYEKNKINNPLTNILFFGFMAGASIYVISFYLPPIIMEYWLCIQDQA